MIIDRTPLNMNEVEDIIKDLPPTDRLEETKEFLKKFVKAKPEQAKKIKEELEKIDMIKIKNEHIVKIIDLLPSDASELNKIFIDVSLNEDETNKILGVVKNNS